MRATSNLNINVSCFVFRLIIVVDDNGRAEKCTTIYKKPRRIIITSIIETIFDIQRECCVIIFGNFNFLNSREIAVQNNGVTGTFDDDNFIVACATFDRIFAIELVITELEYVVTAVTIENIITANVSISVSITTNDIGTFTTNQGIIAVTPDEGNATSQCRRINIS